MPLTTNALDPGLNKIRDDGQMESYFILSDEERAKGFVRPVRGSYVHKLCGCSTHTTEGIAETFAAAPKTYTHTFCEKCRDHLPIEDFFWEGTEILVGE